MVTNADGTITVQVKGVVFGHFDRGKMTVLDSKADNPNALVTVSNAKMDFKGPEAERGYSGKDVRFLFPAGSYTLKFEGNGIDLSAVGKGVLSVTGKTWVTVRTGRSPSTAPRRSRCRRSRSSAARRFGHGVGEKPRPVDHDHDSSSGR